MVRDYTWSITALRLALILALLLVYGVNIGELMRIMVVDSDTGVSTQYTILSILDQVINVLVANNTRIYKEILVNNILIGIAWQDS